MSTKKSHKAKTAKDWQLRLQRLAAGERFNWYRGERSGPVEQGADKENRKMSNAS